ncbi:uncharacterized protein LOC143536652 [Bidens hawaiensis]|uniref:uncharacterized protein LOC143536652 n=1 Tax=Bidens hawaiensis TaxID=980011 RepID=UPI00404A6637
MGGKIDHSINRGNAPYTFRLSGENYHFLGGLLPVDGRKAQFSQLYIYDTENEISNRQSVFGENDSKVDHQEKHIINYLKTMLDSNNHLVQAYRMVRDCFEENPQLVLKLRIIGTRQHDGRQYNLPSSSKVAALIVGDIGDAVDNRDIIVTKKSGSLKRISELHPSYTPLQYPLFHPFGEDGYQVNILHKNVSSSSTAARKKLTMHEFFAYRIQDRPNTFSTMLNGRRLYQQILVDKYTMIEAQRLHFIRGKQHELRCDTYQSLQGSKIHNPKDVDKFISAEIPNKDSDPDLYKLVSDHMIHGPCGDANQKCTCMGPDRATISLVQNNNGDNQDPNLDEIKAFYDCRYVSACEAAWRIFGFDVHYRFPSVMRLAFHLPGERQVNGPQCFEDIRTVDGVVCETFRDACYKRGLLDDDKEYIEAIEEASHTSSGYYLRNLFATMLITYSLSRPHFVWESTWQLLVDDILYKQQKDQNNPGGVFFVYGYGGTGKTYLWKTLSASIRAKGEVVLNVASSGIASLLLEGGRTTHSRFLIPINLTEDSICPVKGNTDVYELLRQTSLIIWDEAPMIHKHAFEALDRTLKDVMNGDSANTSESLFGGKVVVFGGDFRQILPVVTNGTRSECVNACINSSYIWSKYKLLHIGQGTLGGPNDGESIIDIPDDLLILNSVDPIGDLIRFVYPDILNRFNELTYFQDCALLAPLNEVGQEINDRMLALFPGDEVQYLSSDSLAESEDVSDAVDPQLYSPDLLNGLKMSGMPNHRLCLKVGVPIMLLRNINHKKGLCNGTRLQAVSLGRRVIKAKVVSSTNIGYRTLISQVSFTPTDKKLPFKLRRKQFPIAVCFAMTINKSQGQSLSRVGLYLKDPVFSHGQLYVALSRVKTRDGIKLVIFDKKSKLINKTTNVVYKEIFANIDC